MKTELKRIAIQQGKKYPTWICSDCGLKHGRWREGHLATFHEPERNDPNDKCGWCGTWMKPLTEPRDFGYPPYPPPAAEGEERK